MLGEFLGREESLHRNKHDFLLKLKTCQVCGARLLISVPGEFENLGEESALRRKCCIRETGREAAQRPEASHYGCRRGRCWGSECHLEALGESSVGGEMVRDPFTEHAPSSCYSCVRVASPRGAGPGDVGSTEAHKNVLPVVSELTVRKTPLSWDQTLSLLLT